MWNSLSEQQIVIKGKRWLASTLVDKAKELKPFDYHLKQLDACENTWSNCKSMYNFSQHVKKVLDADLSYPIILNEDGGIMDGWHRIVKALIEGKKTIKAVKFEVEPQAETIEE